VLAVGVGIDPRVRLAGYNGQSNDETEKSGGVSLEREIHRGQNSGEVRSGIQKG